MDLELRPASAEHLSFARALTCQTMLGYYIRHDLPWIDEAFDVAWAGRENWLICQHASVLGFTSLSRDSKALYIRELHVVEASRGQGVGTWAIEQVFSKACAERRPALRLTVFEDNPAQALYQRMGLQIVGQDDCFLRMERKCLR
ncbi:MULTISPECIES: N-acetyltransferase [unclassified Pseudomonas]|uniref:GNAT family N-acetyltransferase n=1 Tax=unclassified Pseudomonas TaxID=196821 RepID=UPI000CD19382|nr:MULTISPECIES: GNAT family N-acetyltransferase [unclassified Pseudomonas]POA33981.1 GNAT family N-acetyltransferase [Pseudomonas sp. GW456-R21]POA66127.1 GNAT family N-acetyltransferase [Pseudomonas sp. GW460-R15]